MKRIRTRVSCLVAGAALAATGVTGAQPAADARRSGFDFMGPATQALQRDDAANPAMLWVADGGARWQAPAGRSGKSCADCHGDARQSMRGVAARYPRFDAQREAPVTLGTRIAQCRERHQQAPAPRPESDELLALETFIAHQSRGLPLAPDPDPRLDAHRARGAELWRTPFGQLALSCAQCHDTLAGRRLGGNPIPQGHATGYPIYRLEWQAVGSLERRLRNCLAGVRATPFAYGALEHAQLALHLAGRAAGMPLETPAVRP